MKIKTLIVSAVLTLFLMALSCNSIYADINLDFSADISTEFPNITEYNNFKSDLINSFGNMFKYNNIMISVMVTSYFNSIIDEVDDFSFGVLPILLSYHNFSDGSSINDIENRPSYSGYGLSIYFGTSLYKNLDIFISTGAYLPILISFLWKFYEKRKNGKKKKIKSYFERDENGKLKLKKAEVEYIEVTRYVHKLFLAPSIGFCFSKRKGGTSTFEDLDNTYSFKNGTFYIPNESIELDENNINKFIFIFDISLKYNLFIKWFNLHFTFGITVHVYNIEESYNLKNVNVDYNSYGSATGINTNINIAINEKYVYIIPHFNLGISFTLAKWIKFPVLSFSLYYVMAIKKIILGPALIGLCLYF